MMMIGKTLCVSYNELVGTGIMSKSNYDKHVREGRISIVQRGCRGREAQISLESLPSSIKKEVEERHTDALSQVKPVTTMEQLKSDPGAVEFFRSYNPRISLDRQEALILNAKVLNAMQAVELRMIDKQGKCGKIMSKVIRENLISCAARFREEVKHTLPRNAARLMEKYRLYRKNGYAELVNNNVGNQSARKIGPEEGRLLLKLKRSKFPVYTDMQIFEEFNRLAAVKGYKKIDSPQTVINYLYTTSVKLWWWASVYGEVSFNQTFMPDFDTILPELAHTLWYADGTRCNLFYKEYDSRQKKMVMRTIDVYEVMDAATECFIGYSFGNENFASQYDAFRMAVSECGVKPYEIVVDNQSGLKSEKGKAFLGKICQLFKYTQPHRGQAKTIESAFGRFQQQHLHKFYNFSGQNITAKKESSRANMELITKNIAQLPTYDEMVEQYLSARNDWNNEVHPTSKTGLTRLEMMELCSPKAQKLDQYEAEELFKLLSPTSVTYRKNGCTIQIDNEEFTFVVYTASGEVDMNFHLNNIGKSFRYRYDPRSMSCVELWEVTATGIVYAATATPAIKIHRATADRTEDDNKFLAAQLRANERARAAIYIASEDLMIEESLSEAYSRLVAPRPVGLSAQKLEEYRSQYDDGRLVAPAIAPIAYHEEAESLGDYTKKTSQMTLADYYNDL